MGRYYWVHSAPADAELDDPQRECARAHRCANARIETENGRPVRRGAWTPRGICDTCATHLQRALHQLPDLWARLHDELGNKTPHHGPRVTVGKAEPPVPINLAVDALLREAVHVLASWAERVAATARLNTEPGRRIDQATVDTSCRILAAHVSTLLALPEEPMLRTMPLHQAATLPPGTTGLVHPAAEYADVILPLDGTQAGVELLELHHRIRRMLGETRPPARHLPTPCRCCGHRLLFETHDADGQWDGAHCRNCRAEYTLADYWVLVQETARNLAATGANPGHTPKTPG